MISKRIARHLHVEAIPVGPKEEGKTLRTAILLAVFGYTSATLAANFHYDGKTAIPVGIQPRSATVLRLPEPISKWWAEEEAKFGVNEVDARTLSLYPLVPETEQRLFLRGDSGQLYVAKISTALSHVPIVNVIDVSKPAQAAAPTAPASLSPTTLLIKLMKNEPAQGFAVATSSMRLVTAEQWVMDALEVWSAPGLTGIVAKISRTTQAGTSVAINPDAIEITSPQLGQFRMMNAERWALDDALPQTNAYLVFTKR